MEANEEGGNELMSWKGVRKNLPNGHLKFEGTGIGGISQVGTKAGQADEGGHCTCGEDV